MEPLWAFSIFKKHINHNVYRIIQRSKQCRFLPGRARYPTILYSWPLKWWGSFSLWNVPLNISCKLISSQSNSAGIWSLNHEPTTLPPEPGCYPTLRRLNIIVFPYFYLSTLLLKCWNFEWMEVLQDPYFWKYQS